MMSRKEGQTGSVPSGVPGVHARPDLGRALGGRPAFLQAASATDEPLSVGGVGVFPDVVDVQSAHQWGLFAFHAHSLRRWRAYWSPTAMVALPGWTVNVRGSPPGVTQCWRTRAGNGPRRVVTFGRGVNLDGVVHGLPCLLPSCFPCCAVPGGSPVRDLAGITADTSVMTRVVANPSLGPESNGLARPPRDLGPSRSTAGCPRKDVLGASLSCGQTCPQEHFLGRAFVGLGCPSRQGGGVGQGPAHCPPAWGR